MLFIGTGENAQVKHFQIAGKTSTAQKPSNKGGYEGYIPAFVGYPTNIDKRFVVYVYLDSPKGPIYYGNLVAAPIFRKVSQYLLLKTVTINMHLKGIVKLKTLLKIQSSNIKYKKD